jgi:hypothetical protein
MVQKLREEHEDLEDDARWVAVTCPKSGNSCEGYKLFARPSDDTKINGGSTGH